MTLWLLGKCECFQSWMRALKMTFAANLSSFGYRPVDEAKVNVIVRTKSGAAIHSWNFGISVRCADKDRPLAPVTHDV